MASVRFSQVVAAAGEPVPHAFWLPPEKDAEFQRALKANRVMTVAPRAHGKADVGRVGFDGKDANGSQVLVFPKSLKRFEDAEVIGVKFDRVQQPEVVAAKTELRRTTARTKRARQAKRIPTETHAAPVAGIPAPGPARVRQTPPASGTPATARTRAQPETRHAPSDYDDLAKEVRAALEVLRDGKAVAAYQRLERALG